MPPIIPVGGSLCAILLLPQVGAGHHRLPRQWLDLSPFPISALKYI